MVANGTTLSKREVSWDDALDGNFPPVPTPDSAYQQAVVQAANSMNMQPYNDGKGKLQKAMDLVLANKVQAHEDGLYTVQGSTKSYEIDGTCPCPQGQLGKSKWCKHLVAVELWKRTQQRLYPVNGHGQGNGDSPTWVDRAKAQPKLTLERGEPVPAGGTAHWTDVLAPICHTIKYVVDGVEHVTVIRG